MIPVLRRLLVNRALPSSSSASWSTAASGLYCIASRRWLRQNASTASTASAQTSVAVQTIEKMHCRYTLGTITGCLIHVQNQSGGSDASCEYANSPEKKKITPVWYGRKYSSSVALRIITNDRMSGISTTPAPRIQPPAEAAAANTCHMCVM